MTSTTPSTEMLSDIPNNLQANSSHGIHGFTFKNEERSGSSIQTCFDNCIQLSSETYHSLIKWESENL